MRCNVLYLLPQMLPNRYRQGFGNRLFICEIHDEKHGESRIETNGARPDTFSSPSKVLIRLYGGNALPQDAPIRTLSSTGEILVFCTLGIYGMGPRLYGVFDGGRIEEFINSRNLSVKEWCECPTFNRLIAQRLADFNCLALPLDHDPWNLGKIVRTCLTKYWQEKENIISVIGQEQYQKLSFLLDFDVVTEVEWVEKVLTKLNSRVVFAHNDVNRSNLLLKLPSPDTESSDDSDKQQLLLIDYEFSGYNYRAFELGNYFGMKVFDFGAEVFRTGYDFPDEEYRRQFVTAYLEQAREKEHFIDWDESGRDSIEHVMMEGLFGSFAVRLVNISWLLRDFLYWQSLTEARAASDPTFDFSSFIDFYLTTKEEFIRQYPEMNM